MDTDTIVIDILATTETDSKLTSTDESIEVIGSDVSSADNLIASDSLLSEAAASLEVSDMVTASDSTLSEAVVITKTLDKVTASDNLLSEAVIVTETLDKVTASDNLLSEAVIVTGTLDKVTASDNLLSEATIAINTFDSLIYKDEAQALLISDTTSSDILTQKEDVLTVALADIQASDVASMVDQPLNTVRSSVSVEAMYRAEEFLGTSVNASISIIDKRKRKEQVLVTIISPSTVRDRYTYKLSIAVERMVATYPLTNSIRSKLSFFSPTLASSVSGIDGQTYYRSIGWTTPEIMLVNAAQLFTYGQDIYNRKLLYGTHKSDVITIGGVVWTPYYVSGVGHKTLCLSGYKSEELTIPTTTQSINASSINSKRVNWLTHLSNSVALVTGAQAYNFGLVYAKSKLVTPSYKSTSLTLMTSSIAMEYSTKKYSTLKILGTTVSMTDKNIGLYTGDSNLSYGDNTFYSLNGYFNYFRYRHVDILNTSYHILIGNRAINMYNSAMSCIESHRAGYKRVVVPATFLKDINGAWLDTNTLAHVFYEDKFTFYTQTEQRLYTYDFDNISFTNSFYHNIDSDLLPTNVQLFLDPVYMMPYIMPRTSEGNQRITQADEFWNFLQINNIKLLNNYPTVVEAEYTHEVFVPTALYLNKILFRLKDQFILQGTRGMTEKFITTVNTIVPSTFTELVAYHGSDILYSEYPKVYYSEYGKDFTSTSVYSRLIILNLLTMDFEAINLEHYVYKIFKDERNWHLYKKVSNGAYYLHREGDEDKVVNLTTYLSLGLRDIIEFMVFNTYDVYVLTSDRQVYTINVQTMTVKTITTIGTPILFIKFTQKIGCILTRKDSDMYFEELQPVIWSNNSADWITPYDMRKGELLRPYELFKSSLHARLAPIVTLLDDIVVERISDKYVELELGVTGKMAAQKSEGIIYPVKVGQCTQTVYSHTQYSDIDPQTYEFGHAAYSKELETISVLNEDDTFTISIKALPMPETLQAGFKLYEK